MTLSTRRIPLPTTTAMAVLSFTVSSPPVTTLISNWAIDEDNASGSDHEIIKFKIRSDSDDQVLPPTTERWNWKKAAWEAFTQTLKETSEATKDVWSGLHEQGGQINIDSTPNYLTKIIQMSATLHVPKKIITVHAKPWWTDEISQKRTIMNTRLREWKAERTTPSRNQFAAVRNAFFNAVCDAKPKNWNNFLQGAFFYYFIHIAWKPKA